MTPSDPPSGPSFSRRSFLKGASAAAVAGPGALAASPAVVRPSVRRFGKGEHEVRLRINGREMPLKIEPRTTLLDALRDRLDLTGTKKICDRGACGGCTVLLNGDPINSCMTLALDAVGQEVVSIEGLAQGDQLHPLQRAFIECDALQCGFCTPGMVMSAYACLRAHPTPTHADMEQTMAGNICRCGTYTRVFEAIERTAKGGRR
jgi:aerobic-type carbon monoxide dehydrogenase small subunit (CoxS/CutS family)